MALEQEFCRTMAYRVRELVGRGRPLHQAAIAGAGGAIRSQGRQAYPVSRSAQRPSPPLRIVPSATAIPGSGEA
ncbi:hypothetical protein ACVI1J_006168 [Bradyrhizobium diazoefficiens]